MTKQSIDVEDVKQRVRAAIRTGAMWKNAEGHVVTSIFELAVSLKKAGVDYAQANSLPAVNAVFLIDGQQLQTFFGDEQLELQQRLDTSMQFL